MCTSAADCCSFWLGRGCRTIRSIGLVVHHQRKLVRGHCRVGFLRTPYHKYDGRSNNEHACNSANNGTNWTAAAACWCQRFDQRAQRCAERVGDRKRCTAFIRGGVHFSNRIPTVVKFLHGKAFAQQFACHHPACFQGCCRLSNRFQGGRVQRGGRCGVCCRCSIGDC